MTRNKTIQGKKFNTNDVQKAWEKAKIITGVNPDIYRKDHCGAWIKQSDYGTKSSSLSYGWEIDHIKPKSKGGEDEFSNLQPLHWENNRGKSDNYPQWDSSVTSVENKNVYLEK